MNNKITDAYILYKLKCSSDNSLEAYFPFFANIILDKKIELIDENRIAEEFLNRYSINVSTSFVRQVLGIGVENKSIVKKAGKYVPDKVLLKDFKTDESEFEKNWKYLKNEYKQYCKNNQSEEYNDDEFERAIFLLIDSYNIKNVIDSDWIINDNSDSKQYHWYSFLKQLANSNEKLFDFVVYLSASNAYKEALFFATEDSIKDDKWKSLNVYLDSPMVFALLGMDSEERTNSYLQLVKDMQCKGCKVCILDNNYEEVKGIIVRASGWATSTAFDISKANKVAKYFHDSGMSKADINEYCEELESKLNELGISIKTTKYDPYSNSFQEDENQLNEMVKQKYSQDNMVISLEKQQSIDCDVKSIVMIYRERSGKVSTLIQECYHIMLTLNGALANVCKEYERKKSLNAGHIPACISADLFGAIIWLNSPITNVEYQKKKILADCFSALKPNKLLLSKYVESLESAHKSGEIDEKRYLFLRSHSVAVDALMNVTKGDYARFDDRTYLEVYEEIQAIANSKLQEEKNKHEETKSELEKTKEENKNISDSLDFVSREFKNYKEEQEENRRLRYEKKCNRIATFITCLICFMELVLFGVFEFIKVRITSSFSWQNLLIIIGLLIIVELITVFKGYIKNKILKICKKIIKIDEC